MFNPQYLNYRHRVSLMTSDLCEIRDFRGPSGPVLKLETPIMASIGGYAALVISGSLIHGSALWRPGSGRRMTDRG